VGVRLAEFVDPKRHEVTQEAALASIGIDLGSVRSRLEDAFGPGALPDPTATPPFTPKAKQSLERALRRALTLRHRYIGTEHELLGILEIREGVACSALLDLGVDLDALDADVVALAAPDQARASAAWSASFQLQIGVQALDEPQKAAAQEAVGMLIQRRGEALQTEQQTVRAAAIDAAERIEQATADTRQALAELGIQL
jgi:ATP-dependent Clp protease ATP-binding subunit ClpA